MLCVMLCFQRSVKQRFSMRCCLMKNLLVVSTSGNWTKWWCTVWLNKTAAYIHKYMSWVNTHPTPDWSLSRHVTSVLLVCLLRCTSPRGYRLPPCALINLSHGARVDHTSHKLTAIVKPQPVTGANFNSQRQLAGLNHSPRSPFIPTQVRGERMHTMQQHTVFSPVWNDKTVWNVVCLK